MKKLLSKITAAFVALFVISGAFCVSVSAGSPAGSTGNTGGAGSTGFYDGFSYLVNSGGTTATIIGFGGNATAYGSLPIPSTIYNGNNTYIVTAIGARVFYGNSVIKYVEVPNTITSIGNEAFRECVNLDSVYLSEYVTSIGTNVFTDCPALTIYAPSGSYAVRYAYENGIKVNFSVFNAIGPYWVVYNLNGAAGTPPPSRQVAKNGKASKPTDPTRSGYTFAGWFLKKDGTGTAWDFNTNTVTEDMVLFAKWVLPYKITYFLNGGTNPTSPAPPTAYTYDAGATLPTPTRNGYTFDGWYTTSDFRSGTDVPLKIEPNTKTGDLVLYAKWKSTTYKLDYYLDGGTLPASAPYSYSTDKTLTLPTPTRSGYTFAGWYTNFDRNGNAIYAITAGSQNGDLLLYAKWSQSSYTITYETNGGSLPAGSPTSYTYASGTGLPTPTMSGYKFIGWYTNRNFTGAKLTSISPYTNSSNLILYAKWLKITDVPKGFSVRAASYNSIALSWDEVEDADGYEIYVATGKDGTYSLYKTIKKGETISSRNTGLKTGTTYYYKIRSYSKSGSDILTSGFSEVKSAKPVLKKPASVRVSAESKSTVEISWNEVAGASGYEVHRSVSRDSGFKRVKTVRGDTECENSGLKSNTVYYYKVIAFRTVNGIRIYSPDSAVKSVRTLK